MSPPVPDKTAARHFMLLLVMPAILLTSWATGATIAAAGPDNAPSRNLSFYLVHDAIPRLYMVHVPSQWPALAKRPLVIALHGGGGSAKAAADYFGLEKLAERENFIIAYPQGTGARLAGRTLGTWNAGSCCGPAQKNRVDDVGFIERMINLLKRDFNVDPRRIYVTGMSNGAMMAWRLACDLSHIIAAIAPVASAGTYVSCHPKRPVPTLYIHGLADPCAPFDGCRKCTSCIGRFLRELGLPVRPAVSSALSAPDFIEKWRRQNGCRSSARISYQNRGSLCRSYEHCRGDVIFCRVARLGHIWPGRRSPALDACRHRPQGRICRSWKRIIGPANPDFPANRLIWNFFRRHEL